MFDVSGISDTHTQTCWQCSLVQYPLVQTFEIMAITPLTVQYNNNFVHSHSKTQTLRPCIAAALQPYGRLSWSLASQWTENWVCAGLCRTCQLLDCFVTRLRWENKLTLPVFVTAQFPHVLQPLLYLSFGFLVSYTQTYSKTLWSLWLECTPCSLSLHGYNHDFRKRRWTARARVCAGWCKSTIFRILEMLLCRLWRWN